MGGGRGGAGELGGGDGTGGGGGGGGDGGGGGGGLGGDGGGLGSPLKMTDTPLPRKVVIVRWVSLAAGRTDRMRPTMAMQAATARQPRMHRFVSLGPYRAMGSCNRCGRSTTVLGGSPGPGPGASTRTGTPVGSVGPIRACENDGREKTSAVRPCSSSGLAVLRSPPTWARPVFVGMSGSPV